MPSTGQLYADVIEACFASVRENADMSSACGVADPGTERFHVVHIKDHDLVLADQLHMVGAPAGEVEPGERVGFVEAEIPDLIALIVQHIRFSVQAQHGP